MTDRELVQKRTFDAPPDVVYEAWTTPQHLDAWWGPNGFTTSTQHHDLRAGGEWRYVMHGPDGVDYPNLVAFHEVVPGQRLAYTHGTGEANDPNAFETVVTFENVGGRTELTMTATFPSAEVLEYVKREFHADEGGKQTLARLSEYLPLVTHYRNGHTVRGNLVLSLPSDTEMMYTREFDAPRELVFEAFLDPQAIPQWWGPARYTTVVHELDARAGGRWRFVSHGADGAEYAFNGEFREVSRYDRIVQTFEFEGAPGHISVDTADFKDLNGRTLVIGHSKVDSPEALQGMADSGMEDGMAEGYDRLETMVASQAGTTVVLKQTFDAPVEVVWQAWTTPDRFAHWYGPDGFTVPECTIDLRVGGARGCMMHGPGGMQMRTVGTVLEVVPLKRFAYMDEAVDAHGHPALAPDGSPYQTRVTATFEDLDGKTKVTLLHSGFPDGSGAREGWTQAFDKLAESLGNDIVIERTFDAPRSLVWQAWTTPDHLKRWWSPDGATTPVANIDLRVGGKWHYCMRDADGKDFWSTGTFREVVPQERIVVTDSFADDKGKIVPASHYGMGYVPLELLVTTTFEDLGDNRTKVTLRHSGFPASEHRNMAEQGWGQLLDKLSVLLQQIR